MEDGSFALSRSLGSDRERQGTETAPMALSSHVDKVSRTWSKEELGESGKRDPAVMQHLGKKPLGVLHVAQMDGLHIKD